MTYEINMNDIIRFYPELKLKKEGDTYSGFCPFHSEKRPSFKISIEKNIWKCFGECGRGGGPLAFIREYEKITSTEELHNLILNKFGVKTRWYENHLEKKDPKYRFKKYLKNRGISVRTAKYFKLECGLKDRYKNRIKIPIYNENNRFIGYASRDITGKSKYRYLFDKGLEKSKYLYNLNNIRKQKNLEEIILIEGFFSVFKLYEFGIKNSVSSMGCRLSKRQYELLEKEGEKGKLIKILFDGDEAGYKASEEVYNRLSGKAKIRNIKLPEGKQPDEIDKNVLLKLVH